MTVERRDRPTPQTGSHHTVVIEHGDAVGGDPGVALEPGGPEPDRQLERLEGVLRGMGPRPAMGEQDGGSAQRRKTGGHRPVILPHPAPGAQWGGGRRRWKLGPARPTTGPAEDRSPPKRSRRNEKADRIGMTVICVTCGGCGDVELSATAMPGAMRRHRTGDLCVHLSRLRDGRGASGRGPRGRGPRSAGVTCAEWQLPAELAESRIGPPLTHDDLLDFHAPLRTSDWFAALESLPRTTEPDR